MANAPAFNASVEAFANKLQGECPGVLSNAPRPEGLRESGNSPQRGARARGERNREQRQLGELELELSEGVSFALVSPDRKQALAYVQAVASLSWTNASVTAYVHAKAAALEWELRSGLPDVCADMKTWVGSGYRTLSTATKARMRQRDAIELSGREQLEALRGPNPSTVLTSFEDARDKIVVRELNGLAGRVRTAVKGLQVVYERLRLGLGLGSEGEELEGPPKGATVIDSGMTAAGSSFTIWIEPKGEGAIVGQSQCPLSIGLEERETDKNGSSSGGGSTVCLSRSHPEEPRLQCDGERWQIEGQTVEGAQSVTLTLSSGQQINSPVAIVPAADGGPAGFYYQVLRKPAQTPVSLTELDASGTPLLTIKLSPQSACPRNVPAAPKPPESLPGGGIVAVGRVPRGPQFVITGFRMRFQGRIENNFSIMVMSEELLGYSASGESIEIGGPRPRPSPFELQSETGCRPHEYAIIYGLLKAPKDTVLVRTGTGFRALRRVPIPRSMHLHGVVAYVALSAFPREILVRTPAGKTMFAEKLTRRAHEDREICEGEAEGPAS